ncbi:MAG: RIP metalloprotease RseP [Bacteroidales bacterium]|nr:RIP metalloprotease RseP [Bacteroidales bacterium]
MKIIIQLGQLLLSLSILIILHELGHFILARVFKVRVEKFYLFFDPWFSIFKLKRGETEYGIGWLPLGGYVKISGMIDESMDKEQLKKPPQPYEFRTKPAWQRLLIMLGGVMVNLILGFMIYSFILFIWGEKYLPNKSLTDGIWVTDSIMYETGLQTGDKIISVNGVEPDYYREVLEEMFYGGEMLIERNGKDTALIIAIDFPGKISDYRIHNKGPLILERQPYIISKVPDTSINADFFKSKDQVIAINEIPIKYYDQAEGLQKKYSGSRIKVTVIRNSEEISDSVLISDKGKFEVEWGYLTYEQLEKLGYYKLARHEYSFLQSIPAGFKKAKDNISSYLRQFKLIFDFKTGAYKGLGGFGAIGGLFPPVWDWQTFWEITAFLSLMLAVLNLLPIPALDGGHVTFLMFEMITGRKPGDKFLEYAQIAGMILLLFLLIYANGNDLYRWILRLIAK